MAVPRLACISMVSKSKVAPRVFRNLTTVRNGTLYLGAGEGGTAHLLTGTLDDVRVYEGALNDEEILGILTDPALVGWYTFDEGDGRDAVDSTGKQSSGRIIGSEPQWKPDDSPHSGRWFALLVG